MSESEKHNDVALVIGESDEGNHLAVLRQREGQVAATVLSRVEDGQSLHQDLVRLKKREEHPLLFDVETVYQAPEHRVPNAGAKATAGPGQVANRAYRAGWERLFGTAKKRRGPKTLN